MFFPATDACHATPPVRPAVALGSRNVLPVAQADCLSETSATLCVPTGTTRTRRGRSACIVHQAAAPAIAPPVSLARSASHSTRRASVSEKATHIVRLVSTKYCFIQKEPKDKCGRVEFIFDLQQL